MRSDVSISVPSFHVLQPIRLLVRADDLRRAADAASGEDLVVLLDVKDGRRRDALSGAIGDVRGTGESDLLEVGEADERVAGLEVLSHAHTRQLRR